MILIEHFQTCGAKLLLLSLSVQFVIIFIITILDISTFIILITCRKSIFKGQSKENKQRDINFAMQVRCKRALAK